MGAEYLEEEEYVDEGMLLKSICVFHRTDAYHIYYIFLLLSLMCRILGLFYHDQC